MADTTPRHGHHATWSSGNLRSEPTEPRGASGPTQDKVRESLRAKLFGIEPDPVKIGRFVILGRLGQGGMGTVYSAFDPDLERRVALKMLRNRHLLGVMAEDRLLREAQALARLSHPNVVPVYEVGLIGEQIFIVMEFVKGRNLTNWVDEEEPSWRAILDVYQQAGRGLAAAHEAGMVHRDFKPDNVQIGDDGRVRVLDFGIVRTSDASSSGDLRAGDSHGSVARRGASAADDPASERLAPTRDDRIGNGAGDVVDSLDSKVETDRLTATGAIIGTPAFMAPEQFSGAAVDPRSDQFGFCASLYRSLYRQPAFAGATPDELMAAVERGEVTRPSGSSDVPGWILAIVRRGLAHDPDERYPSMDALLAALARDPARVRRRWLIGGLVAAVLVGTLYGAMSVREDAVAPCRFDDASLAGVWDGPRRAELQRVLAATSSPYAARAWARIELGLDGYADRWLRMRTDACLAHQRGEQSAVLLDRRIACLDTRLDGFDSSVSVLMETEPTSLARSVDVVQNLPPLARCADAKALMAVVAPPEEPATRARVHELERELGRAAALHHGGRYSQALAATRDILDQAEGLAYRPFLARAMLLQGHITMSMGDRALAADPLHQAMRAGFASGVDTVALEALARLLFVQGQISENPDVALSWLDIAEPLSEHAAEARFEHALLLNNAGAVSLRMGRREMARQLFERALAAKPENLDGRNIELVNIWLNLAFVSTDSAARAAYLETALGHFDARLGAEHPESLKLQVSMSSYLQDPRVARNNLQRACALLGRYHPGIRKQGSECLYSLGFLEAELGDRGQAAEYFTRAAALFRASESGAVFADLADGYALLLRGHDGQALNAFLTAQRLIGQKRAQYPWLDLFLGHALLGLGLSHFSGQAPDRLTAARAALEEAVTLLDEAGASNHKMDTRRRLAQAQYALAAVLRELSARPGGRPPDNADDGTDHEARAHRLESQSAATYLSTAPGHEDALRSRKPWLRASALAP